MQPVPVHPYVLSMISELDGKASIGLNTRTSATSFSIAKVNKVWWVLLSSEPRKLLTQLNGLYRLIDQSPLEPL